MTTSNALYDMYMSQYGMGDVQAPFTFQVATPGSQPVNFPMSNIETPGINDVMCGRGGATNNHIGNIRFRQLVNEHKLRYLAAPKSDKPKVAGELVQIWRSLVPPGRFLARSDPDMGDDSLWHDIGDKKARQKCSQSLRERTPDVIPFVQQLQQKQKEDEEKRKLEHEQLVTGSGSGDGGGVSSSNSSSTSSSGGNQDYVKKEGETRQPHEIRLMSIPENPVSSSHVGAVSNNNTPLTHNNNDVLLSTDDAYLDDVDDFLENAPEGDRDTFSVADHSMAFSTHSWIRSVQSVDSGAMMSLGESIREEDVDAFAEMMTNPSQQQQLQQQQQLLQQQQQQQQQMQQQQPYTPPLPLVPSAIQRPAMPNRAQNVTRSQKMNLQAVANFSMLSDLTDRSAQRSIRSSKMNEASKLNSNFSMRSETTDISAAMRALVADPPSIRQQQSLRSTFQESAGNFSKLSMMSGLTDLSEGLNNIDLRK